MRILRQSFIGFIVTFVTSFSFSQVKIGIYQGTFDPPHLGHEEILVNAIAKANLDHVYVLAMPDSQEKPMASPFHLRQLMVNAHFSNLPQFLTPSETVIEAFQVRFISGLYEQIRSEHPYELELFHIIGSDAVAKYPFTQRDNHKDGVQTLLNIRSPDDLTLITEKTKDDPEGPLLNSEKVHLLPHPQQRISSTQVRTNLHDVEYLSSALRRNVIHIIRLHRLYVSTSGCEEKLAL